MPRTGTGPDFIEALARGLEVIAAFEPGREAMTLGDVATATGLARPTAAGSCSPWSSSATSVSTARATR